MPEKRSVPNEKYISQNPAVCHDAIEGAGLVVVAALALEE